MKKTFSLILSVLAAAAIVLACNKPENNTSQENQEQNKQENKEQEELEPFLFTVNSSAENLIFDGKPVFNLHLENPNAVAATAEIRFNVLTDKGKKVTTIETTREVAAKGTADIVLTTDDNLDPGFYKATGKVGRKTLLSGTMFGVNPFQIVSAPDKQPDFEEFWDAAYAQLKAVDMNAVLVPTNKAGTYMVTLQSVPDGLEGEPMTIRGYYVEPVKDGKKHPAIVHYYGYDDFVHSSGYKLYCPSGSDSFAHLYLSSRGQRINSCKASEREDGIDEDYQNPYTVQWFTVNFGDKDSYYYRGAYMDCVQGIRFLALCDEVKDQVDMDNVFVEGMSQGGAFSYAAASLSKEYPVKGIAAAVAFMGDFPDYFTIVPNEGGGFPGMAQSCKQKLGWTDDQMYGFLSYFDTKNLATKISCPIYACIGLMDNICPPHTNIAPYNNALTPASSKQMTFYPKMGHSTPSGWDSGYRQFFQGLVK
jgi:cephalosporin-C deacetylase-like acetyl esterase